MRNLFFAFFILTVGWTGPLGAQDTAEDDKSFIESWLQDALSDAGRDVSVVGFEGALSSNATLDSLTISDDDGVWFTMRDASLQWSRSALVSGRLEVTELSASEIVLSRLPEGGGVSPEDAEAWEFSLPELPVSVELEHILAGKITLGPDVLGEAAVLSLDGGLSLSGGDGAATLNIQRKDRDDRLAFEGAFSNTTRVLKLDFDFVEARGGIVSKVLRVPGGPDLRLQVKGEAPLADFNARIALSSDGQRRFGGNVKIVALESEEIEGHAFSADLSGDVRPLFTPDLHPFFGEAAELTLAGQTLSDGQLKLDQLEIASGALQAQASLALSASGWPETIQLTARIGGEGDVRLPLAGPATTLRLAEIAVNFDASRNDAWQAEARVNGLTRDGLRLQRARFAGNGRISRAPDQSLTADLTFEAFGVDHDNLALAEAIGPSPSGAATLEWRAQNPLVFDALRVESGDLVLTASGRIDNLADGFPVTGRAALSSTDLSRFSGLAGRDVAGAANAEIEGSGTLLGGVFDVKLDADTTDLRVGEPRLDPLLLGEGTLALAIQRGTDGTVLDQLAIRTRALEADVAGRLDASKGQLDLEARLEDIAPVEPRLSGPATLEAGLRWQAGDALEVARLEATAAGAALSATGALYPEDPTLPAEGKLTLVSDDLSRLADLAGRQLEGQVRLTLEGSGDLQGQTLDLTSELQGKALRTGLAELDRLIAGSIGAKGSFAFGGERPDLRYFNIETPRLSADAKGSGPGGPVAVSARLSDLAVLLPGYGGAATARGSITIADRFARQLALVLDVSGPGGVMARIGGDVRDYGGDFSLSADGSAPLGLANRFISPRSLAGLASFNLRLDGPPRLSSLSGVLRIGDGRLALPRLATALSGLTGTLQLQAGRVETDITGTAGTGGGFRVRGPVALDARYVAALDVTLSELGISDPNLYRTTVSGGVSVAGPMTGGARISGTLNLGRTELRVPSGGTTIQGPIAGIRHVNEPSAVRETRRRAGLIGQAGSVMAAYPLDLTINAPNRIFVRGRGLDAELGGALRLGGTTTDVSASGLFELVRGRLDILGRRLVLTEGVIDLRGALDPYLRFVAETETDDFVVSVILEGLASAPSVSFVSVPDLPQEEVVARLLFGRGLDKISPFQAAQLVSAAATLSGQRSDRLSGGLRNAFGLSDFDVTSTDEGATQLRAGAYISEKVYSEVTADSEGNQEINLKLDLSPSVTVKGSTDTAGNTGVGIFFEKDY